MKQFAYITTKIIKKLNANNQNQKIKYKTTKLKS